MSDLLKLFGPVGLALVLLALPYVLQVVKQLTNWDGNKMLVASLVATYIPIDLLVLKDFLLMPLTASAAIDFILAATAYPLLIWFGTQGLYTKFLKK
jgi:hypothetical protein